MKTNCRHYTLRLQDHRGAFTRPEVVRRAASYAAYAVHDIQADVIDSFQPLAAQGVSGDQSALPAYTLQILLEEVDDNPAFAGAVALGVGITTVLAADLLATHALSWQATMGLLVVGGLLVTALVVLGLGDALLQAIPLTAVILLTDDRQSDAAHTALPGMRPLPGSA